MIDNRVQLEVFEGPLDLLLYLVKKEEVDIYEVNLTKVASQFLEYIEVMRQLDLDIAGEFLVMAASLMFIKSKELLPVHQQVAVEEDDEEDPRWELIRQLVEYKKFKDAASRLQEREGWQEVTYPRPAPKLKFDRAERSSGPAASVFDLINAVNAVLKRVQERNQSRELIEDRWTVSEKIEFVRGLLVERQSVNFSELFEETTSRTEVVVTFLAVLELIRLRQISATQPEPFDEIVIAITKPEPVAAEPAGSPESSSENA